METIEYLEYQCIWVEFIQKYEGKSYRKPKTRITRFRAEGARKLVDRWWGS